MCHGIPTDESDYWWLQIPEVLPALPGALLRASVHAGFHPQHAAWHAGQVMNSTHRIWVNFSGLHCLSADHTWKWCISALNMMHGTNSFVLPEHYRQQETIKHEGATGWWLKRGFRGVSTLSLLSACTWRSFYSPPYLDNTGLQPNLQEKDKRHEVNT